jgi:hypothetical protein
MGKVISLQEKQEVWKQAYEKGGLRVHISTHGKFKFYSGNEITQLEFFDSVSFLKDLSIALESVMGKM